MKLDCVTITGADDSIAPGDLVQLSKEFPFVEWGILMSKKQMGNNRFPSLEWMDRLVNNTDHLRLSAHICGQWVRDLVAGRVPNLPKLFNFAQRAQLNFHAEKMKFSNEFFDLVCVDRFKNFIIQMDGVNDYILHELLYNGGPVVPLFDTSHGAGVLPNDWPKSISGVYTGYAGGLGFDNLNEQIQKIAKVTDDARIWIDMETKVRSNNDQQFDLGKVRQCLEIASKYVCI